MRWCCPPGNCGHAVLIDVGSTNGTTVIRHGRSVELGVAGRGALLDVGDVVELGGTRLQVMSPADCGGNYHETRDAVATR